MKNNKFSKANSLKQFRRAQILTFTAALAAISVVLNVVEINLGTDFKLSLSYLPSFIAGMFLGPISGLAVGLLGDILGVIIRPVGPWLPLVTLGSALMGLIPALVFMIKKIHPFAKLSISLVLVFCICTAGFNSLGIYLAYFNGKQAFLVWWPARLATQSIVLAVNAAVLFAIYFPFDKLIFARLRCSNVTDEDIKKLKDGSNKIDIASISQQNDIDNSQLDNNVIIIENKLDNKIEKDLIDIDVPVISKDSSIDLDI